MKEKNNSVRSSFFKKIFIKICRIIGYEIIDQATYEVITAEKKLHENLATLNKKSITIPTGQIKITRKVKNLHVILRTCMLNEMLAQKKQRLFHDKKTEYTLRTLNSICKSSEKFLNANPDFKIKITVSDTRSDSEDVKLIKNLMQKFNIDHEIVILNLEKFKDKIQDVESIKMFSYMANVYNSFLISKNQDNDLVYFVDDDYLHHIDSIRELVLAYEKISTITNKEIFLCPCDYPYLYFNPENTYILLGNQYHWRRINETLCTFMTSKKMIEDNWNQLIKLVERKNNPFEKPLDKIYENELCFSPISSLSIHCANINSIFGLSPNTNWQKFWEDNKIY